LSDQQDHSFNDNIEISKTGAVDDFNSNTLIQDQSEEGNESPTEFIQDEIETPIEENVTNIIEEDSQDRYPNRIRRRNPKYFDAPSEEEEQAMYTVEVIHYDADDERLHSSLEPFKHHIIPEFEEALAAIQQSKEKPIDLYLPEPRGLKSMLRLPTNLREGWLRAYKIELKNLIEDNQTFSIEKPKPGERVVPTKPVFKAKQTKDGNLEKLKVREVTRGDLKKNEDDEDTWSPGSSFCGVRMHLAQAAKANRTPKLADFIGAYLQARV
jgi:hypothetical protein